ncbi:MAG: site-specific integrase [Acidobacteriota bacterium]|nr:site-specific integrase [Acidobacteriota bacterium]
MKVNLREKILKHDKRSLYLDFYPPIIVEGRRTRREFLSLYIYEKPKTELEREHNRETRLLAENIRSKRQLDLQANPHGFISPRRRNADFLAFFRSLVELRRKKSESARETWQAVLYHLSEFCGGDCTFAQVDGEFCERFRSFLQTCEPSKLKASRGRTDSASKSTKKTLAQNTAKSYFERFVSAVKEAHKKNFLSSDPTVSVEPIRGTTPHREFLLLDELIALARTEADIPDNLRRAALFSALTGLRHSDIENLTWANVRHTGSGDSLNIKIRKTGEPLVLPISEEARELLGTAGEPGEQVFTGLKYATMTNIYIERWTKAAGIARRITFHAFRRTFATAQITLGSDLFTVQRMLGHSNIRQTQIYAHLVDEKKRDAANKITLK